MAKSTKAEANYRPGTPMKNCGICTMFRGTSCTAVEGDISPYATCDYYKVRKNPFKNRKGGIGILGAR